jgi:hypothetical protein
VQIGPRTFVTPGRLSGGRTPTVGLLENVDRQLVFSVFTLAGSVVIDRQVLGGGGAKSKVTVK